MCDDTILFHISMDQAKLLCDHYNVDINKVEEYEICELLDKLIDTLA